MAHLPLLLFQPFQSQQIARQGRSRNDHLWKLVLKGSILHSPENGHLSFDSPARGHSRALAYTPRAVQLQFIAASIVVLYPSRALPSFTVDRTTSTPHGDDRVYSKMTTVIKTATKQQQSQRIFHCHKYSKRSGKNEACVSPYQ